MREGEVKELEELIHRCNIRMSFIQNEATRMYKNRVVSLRETGDCKRFICYSYPKIMKGRVNNCWF